MRIFISYRRDDTRDLAGRVADRLRAHPHFGDVFLDVTSVEAGTSFVAEIQQAMTRDPVCLVLIGGAWHGGRPDGTARLDEPGDVVRSEVQAALAGGLRVIPVLASGGAVPRPETLPQPLRPLATLSALALRHESFDQDMDHLIAAILRHRRAGRLARWLSDHPRWAAVLHAAGGMSVAALLLVAIGVLHRTLLDRSLEETLGDTGTVWVAIAFLLATGTLLGFLRGRRPL